VVSTTAPHPTAKITHLRPHSLAVPYSLIKRMLGFLHLISATVGQRPVTSRRTAGRGWTGGLAKAEWPPELPQCRPAVAAMALGTADSPPRTGRRVHPGLGLSALGSQVTSKQIHRTQCVTARFWPSSTDGETEAQGETEVSVTHRRGSQPPTSPARERESETERGAGSSVC
jgi:hypothetical protein